MLPFNSKVLYFELENIDRSILDVLFYEDKLDEEQEEDFWTSLTSEQKGTLFTHEMGLGKSYLQTFLTVMEKLCDPDKKVLVVAPTESVSNIGNLIKKNTPFRVYETSGMGKKVRKLIKEYDKIDIIVAQTSTIDRALLFHQHMYNFKDTIKAVSVDEANIKSSTGLVSFTDFTRLVDHTYLFNATALNNNPVSIYNSLYAISAVDYSQEKFEKKFSKRTKSGITLDSEAVKGEFSRFILNRNREDLGIKVTPNVYFHRNKISTAQFNLIGASADVRKTLTCPSSLKGFVEDAKLIPFTKKNVPALKTLYDLLYEERAKNPDSNIVIFCNYIGSVRRIYEELKYLGLPAMVITGVSAPTAADKMELSNKFNNSKGMICLLTLERGISLNSSHKLIMYELPSDLSQTIYRIIRGRGEKEIDIDIIYYPEYNQDKLASKMIQIETNNVALNRSSTISDKIREELEDVRKHMYKYNYDAYRDNQQRF